MFLLVISLVAYPLKQLVLEINVMSNDKTVAILLPDLRPGGAEKLHVDLATEWEKIGVKTVFILRKRQGSLLDSLPVSSSIVELKADRVRNVLLPLIKYLKENPPDALLAAMWPLTVIAPIAAKLAGFKGRVIVSEHSPLSIAYARKGRLHNKLMGLTMRLAYRMASARVGVSCGVAEDMAVLSGMARSNVSVINNPAALGIRDQYMPNPYAAQDAITPIILSVGTLKQVKRHDLLIRAFSMLPKTLGARLYILGDGLESDSLKKLVCSLGLEGLVTFAGFVRNTGPWYAHANLFVLSSDYEGFGNVIVEAMEYGLSVVSTDCPVGPREILGNGKFGRLVAPNNAEALASAMLESLEKPSDPAVLKKRALDFSLEFIAEKYVQICLGDAK